jgi:gamma-glutamyltranspeptidase/glutathione hydrolase
MPTRGGAPVTVPGAMHLWHTLVKQLGQLEFKDVLAPAIHYAREGFPVSPRVSSAWKDAVFYLRNKEALAIFAPNGVGPEAGQVMYNKDLAKTLDTVGSEGIEAFYGGAIAEAAAETIQSHGGFVSVDDMKSHATRETVPVESSYRGVRVFEHPPNSQGFAAQLMLNIMATFDMSQLTSLDAERYHIMIEAKKLAYADLELHNADPDFYRAPIDKLLSNEYAKRRAGLVDLKKAMDVPESGINKVSDTVYLATADGEGRAVSFINSLYMSFGSGLVVPGWGIKLQNRGALFSLDQSHPNCYWPGKLPFHTLCPGAIYDDEGLLGVFGIMGGDHQAEAHAQYVSNVIDYHMFPQEAIDHPRFHHDQHSNTVSLEPGMAPAAMKDLHKRGHSLVQDSTSEFGGGQAIVRSHDVWIAGSDRRKDGQASGY